MPQQTMSTTASNAVSPEGIGDVAAAGRRSGYAHLSERRLPTIGQLATAVRKAAAAMARPSLWPVRRGRWQPVPRAARQYGSGRFRVTAVALEPNGFVSSPGSRTADGQALEVLHLVSGRAHLITSGPDGQMRSTAELGVGRSRVVGSSESGGRQGHHFLVNTGNEVAVVARVTT